MPSKTAINWLFDDIWCYSLHVFMEKLFFQQAVVEKKPVFP